MSDKHYIGRVSKVVGTRTTIKGNVELKFEMAIDNGGYRDADGNWQQRKAEFRTVVVYHQLASNTSVTFARHPKAGVGMRLLIVGEERKASFQAKGGYEVPRKPEIVANHLAIELRYNIAAVAAPLHGAADEPMPVEHDDAAEPVAA